MKYVLLTHRRYKSASVLESTVEYATPAEVLARINGANTETNDAISAGVIGHHFADTAEFTYQVVIKAP